MGQIANTDDRELWKRLKQDEELAFQEIFDTYYRYLTIIVYRYLGEEEKSKDNSLSLPNIVAVSKKQPIEKIKITS
mgnify:CR=1 FL=1